MVDLSSESLEREVEEELRQERMVALARRYGPFVVGGLAIALVGGVGYTAWKSWHGDQLAQASTTFLAAERLVESEKPEEAIAAFGTLAGNASGPYPVAALMRKAALHQEANDTAAAIQAYSEAVAQAGAYPVLRDLAILKRALIEADTAGTQEFLANLEPLANNSASVYHYFGLELKAYGLVKSEKLAEARSIYEELRFNAAVPQDIKTRAGQMETYVQQRLERETAGTADEATAQEPAAPADADSGDTAPEAETPSQPAKETKSE